MYRLNTIKTTIKVPPTKLGLNLEKAIKESIAEFYEGKLDKRLGMCLAVTKVLQIGEGKIIPEDANIHFSVTFELLCYKPELQEIVVGDVIDNTEIGVFVRLGPMDGLVHISQIMNDYVSFDEKNSVFLGKESKRTLKEGDSVRARVISIAMMPGKENKVGLTMRQPNFGAFHWIEDDKKKAKKALTSTADKKK